MSITPRLLNSAASFALLALSLASTPALAESAKLKSMSFDLQGTNSTIHVVSTNGQTWDKLKAGDAVFWGHMKVDTKWPGYVEEVAVVLGACSGDQCNLRPLLWSAGVGKRDYDKSHNFILPTSKIPLSSQTGIAVVPYGDSMIARCNQHLQADGPTKSYSFAQEFHATLVANTGKAVLDKNMLVEANAAWPALPYETDHTRTGTFQVQVVCDPVIKSPANDVAYDHGAFDVKDVKLFLTTYLNQQPGANPATVCPSLKVTSRAQANRAGPVSMRIWRQKDGGPITSEFVQAWASFNAIKNGYFATYETWEDVGATSYFQFKTEVVENGSPFAPFDGWKDITVHCTGAGGGGLTTAPRDDPDMPKPQAKWQGEITVADSAGRDKSCPRKGQVFFSVKRDAPGDFNYRVSCTNGASFSGKATGYNQGSGVFEAYAAHDISVNRTRSIQCTLQELQPAPVTVAVDETDFTCANPAIEPAADDFAVPQRSSVDTRMPQVKADPVCDAGEILLRGKCVDKPDVSILCKPGYELVGKNCVRKPTIVAACEAGQKRVNGRCVHKPTVSILCKKGYELRGTTCVKLPTVTTGCRSGQKLVRGTCVAGKAETGAKILKTPVRQLKGKAAMNALKKIQPKPRRAAR